MESVDNPCWRVSRSKSRSILRTISAVSFIQLSGLSSFLPCQPSMMAWLDDPSPNTNRPGGNWLSASAVAASTAREGDRRELFRRQYAACLYGGRCATCVSASGAPPASSSQPSEFPFRSARWINSIDLLIFRSA
jgi:hypothetical protein